MKKLLVIIAVILLHPVVSMAQNESLNTPNININYSIDTLVAPDVFYLNITVVDNKGVGKQGIDNVEKKILLPTLKREGVDVKKDLTIDNLYSSYNHRNKVITSKRYTLKVYSADRTTQIIKKLKSENIVISIGKTEVSNKAEIEQKLRIRALKEASEEANLLLSAEGSKRGRILRINLSINKESAILSRSMGGFTAKTISHDELENGVELYSNYRIWANINVVYQIMNK